MAPRGFEAASTLAALELWRGVGTVCSSPERKAIQTSEPISARWRIPVYLVEGLQEVRRPGGEAGYAAKLRAFFSGHPPRGWEEPEAATSRILTTVDILSSRGEIDVGVVSHGILLTLFVAAVKGVNPSLHLHRSIGFCDLAIFDPRRREIIREFSGQGVRG